MTLQDIKKLSIRDYLERMNIKPQRATEWRGMYLSPFRKEQNASLSVDYRQNVWYDHGTGEGGSIIDLLAQMEHCSINEAIQRLDKNTALAIVPQFQSAEQSAMEITNVLALQHPALLAYLESRKIDLAIAQKYCHEVQYNVNCKAYFAIGFRNDAGGWALRSPNFKGCCAPQTCTTMRNGNDVCMVFEGFMDFLSYLTLKQHPTPTIDTVVLNSVNNLGKALEFLQSHRTVHTFLDNDEGGQKAVADIQRLVAGEVINQSGFYKNHKDLNAYLCRQPTVKTDVKKKSRGLKR